MIFWVDKNKRTYWKCEIDNDYLLNIADGLVKGVGDMSFVRPEVIDNIFEECVLRGLLPLELAHKMLSQAILAWKKRMSAATKSFYNEALDWEDR